MATLTVAPSGSTNPIVPFNANNLLVNHNLLDETKFFETFSTYKIFTLELISIFCNIRKIKAKSSSDLANETPTLENEFILNQLKSKDEFNAAQTLKIINIILKSIKTADLDVYSLIKSITESFDNQLFVKLLNDRIDLLSKNTIIELRNLISDLKIYFIAVNLNDSLIKPWSVVGKYVRRCIIIYEKMPFEKLVCLCKQVSIQFKHLSILIGKSRNPNKIINTSTEQQNSASKSLNKEMEPHYEIDNSGSPTTGCLFSHDESNLTITGEFFNKSANIDCSGMDLEHLDESLTQSNTNYNAFKLSQNNRFNNIKALTSTVSAQRTQSQINLKSNIKSDVDASSDAASNINSNKHSVKFSLKDPTVADISTSNIGNSVNKQLTDTPNNLNAIGDTTNINGLSSSSAMSYALSIKNSCAFSRKIAEYFVAQQAHLIENNEHEALSPVELQQKIDELISYDSSFSEAYYLKYLNFLRLRDYPSALKALHDYFDRLLLAGSVSLAALNLCSLEYRFDSKENAWFALKEAITSAHQEGDIACLQHCLSWLYKMESFNNFGNTSRKNFLIKSGCSRAISNEFYGLAAYNLHYFARTNIGKHQPQAILNLLNKTDMVNLKLNSKIEVNLLSQCHKASLWHLYGQRKLCNLHCQILLNLLPKSSMYKLNTESQLIAMCYLALDFSRNGMISTSQSIINFCKEIYSQNSKISEHWLYTENLILIEKYMLSGKWNLSKEYIKKIATVNIQQALLQEMNIFILEGNLDKAKEIGNKILSNMNATSIESCKISSFINNADFDQNNSNSSSQFEFWNEQMNINLRFNFIQIYISLREFSNALILAIKFYNEIKQLNFNYEFMICCLSIAKILIHMEYPEQAIKYLEKCNIYLLSNGSLLDQAKLHYLYAKCLHLIDKQKNLNTSIAHMNKCIEKLETIQGSVYLISAYAYQCLLLNESSDLAERNKSAHKYRQLRKQLPLVGFLL